jgi:transglutaminase-like putative cysteine protease
MRFSVRHETVYRYSAPVRFAPHRLRLTPRVDAGVLLRHDLDVGPDPLGRDDTLDDYGNRVIDLAFDTPAETLRIESRFVLDTVAPPPLAEAAPLLPARRDPDLAPWLAEPDPDPSVAAFAAAIAATSGGRTDRFLSTLCRTLFERTDRHIRPDGAARSAAETLALGSGACRDLTVLFMAAARVVGLPTRFVSGYQARSETPDGRRHLHAWPEVHVAGVGWRGWDPTHGVAVGDGHVALSAAPDQAATMPIDGGFFGDGVTSTLTYRVEIDAS